MTYTEAYNKAIEEMDDHYFNKHPDKSFDYFLFQKSVKQHGIADKVSAFLTRLDELKFYQAPRNKEDVKFNYCPENLRVLWGAIKIGCFVMSIPDLNYKDLIYHNIDMSLGDLYDLHKQFSEILPAINEHLQAIVLSVHPDSIKEIQTGGKYKFFRASKSDSSLANQDISPSFVKRPLTFT